MTAPTAELLSQVRSETVRWLWGPYLPRGKLVLLDGDPGVGKSLLVIDLAARLSRGGELPDGQPSGRPHVTLLLSAEDNPADTLRPRAEAAGADLDRLVVVGGAGGAPLRFPADLPALEELIRAHSADLVAIDPVTAFLPQEVSANSDQCVRGVLGEFAALAGRTDCAVLLVRHLRKKHGSKAVYRGLGSIGIIGAVRVAWLVAPHPGYPGDRVLAVTKTNLAEVPPSAIFRPRGDDTARATVEWVGPSPVGADDICGPPEKRVRPRDRASHWLLRLLAGGPVPAPAVLQAAAAANIPEATLRRAKSESDVRSTRVRTPTGERVWYWYDPAAPWPEEAPFPKPDPHELPPLEDFL